MIWIIPTALITIADQAVKHLIAANAEMGEVLAEICGFEIVYVKNTGAAFSMLSGKVSVLSVISIVFCIGVILYWIKKKPKQPILCSSLSMLFAGALGNAIDRLFRGYVVDFINASFINFPVFNIADIAIVIGAVLLVIYEIFFDKEDKNANDNSKSDN